VALERRWLPGTARLVQRFADGLDRLERQQPGPELAFRDSIKLMLGIALGAVSRAVAQAHPDLIDRVERVAADFRDRARSRPRDFVLASAVLSLLQPERAAQFARDVGIYVLGLRPEELSDGDAASALWAIDGLCLYTAGESGIGPELSALRDRLQPVLTRPLPDGDVLDALTGYYLITHFVRDLRAGTPLASDARSTTLRAINAFPELARRLRARKHGRPPLPIENEYDVQDILYVALKPHIPDLSDEEWTRKDAGSAKRIDLVSLAARLCIETKMVRDDAHAKALGNELKIDIESYHVHEACDTLIMFVYDPHHHLSDARQQEAQLSGPRTIKGRRLHVEVYVRP
jgi:hypothetical protein